MKRAITAALTALLLVVLCSASVWAQATAQISGTVKDQSGAVLPGVEITATQTDTGVVRTTVSNETGSYVLPSLPTGPYKVEAALPGFRTFVQTGVVLQVNANPVVNPVLEVGQVSEQVEVQANASQVETRSAGVGQVIETQRILDLPLNGRNVTDLITLSGVAVQTGQSPNFGMRTGVNISVAGSIGDGVQYSLDGAAHINPFDGTSMPLPFPDALQEFKVSTSTQDASQGMHSGAAVSAVVKSGTNQFHGDMFEFVRNAKLNARDFFALKNDGLKRNQFGGTIGGPIKKDKMFFFAGYQGTTIRQTPADSTVFVPTPDMLRGDFTAFTSPACNAGRQITLKAPFVNNTVNPALFSPAAVKIAARLPKTADPCGKSLFGNPVHENDHQIPVKVDYQLSAKQALFARYMLSKNIIAIPYTLNPTNVLSANAAGANDLANSLTIGDTYVISPTVVNSFRLSGNRVAAIKPGPQEFGPQDVGINAFTYQPNCLSIPVTGAFTLGCASTVENSFAYTTTYGVNDDITFVKGTHQLAFGGFVMRSIEWSVAQAWSGGTYTVNGSVTGTGMSDFFLGNVSQLRQANPNPLNLSQKFLGAYGMDTWKVNPKLTMTYGFNWSPFFAMSFPQSDVYNFSLAKFYAGVKSTVIPAAPPGFSYPGDSGFNGKSGIQSRYWNFDPRVGLAWDVTGQGKTVIRLGAGAAHDFIRQDLHLNTSSVNPFRLTVIQGLTNLDNPWANYPGGNPFPFNYNRNAPVFTPYGGYLPVPPDMKTHEQYTWNFGIQEQLTPSLFFSGSYIGTHIIHVWNAIELNPAANLGSGPCTLNTASGPVSYPVCTTASNVNQRRILNLANPNANLGYVTQYDDGGTQGYNGVVLDLRWRHGQSVNLSTNYTWSHCIGLPTISLLNPGANYVHQAYQNNGTIDRSLDVGDCSGDRRQIFNATALVKTPKFANSVVRAVAGDWSFSTIYQQRSGAPLNIITGSDVAMNGFQGNNGTQRPNQILASPYGDTNSLTNYLNAAAFANPAPGTYGNLGQSTIVGPAYWDWSEAVSRQFQVREGQRIEFRAEAFNVTNSLRRGNPGTTTGSANTFGRITSSQNGPRILQFALKYIF
jgi:carboxypeptidase family protein